MAYEIGDRVIIIKLLQNHQVRDLKGRTEATGTVVAKPGGVVYDVLFDDPPDPNYNTLTYLGEEDLRPEE